MRARLRSSALAPLVSVFVMAACAAAPPSAYHDAGRSTPQTPGPRPDYPGYGSAVGAQAIPWSLETLVRDFNELMFETEWGGEQKALLRWSGEATVALADAELDAYRGEVAAYLAALDDATPDLDVRLSEGRRGDITLRTAPRADMRRIDASALCFFAPVDADWPTYFRAARRGEIDWEKVERLDKVTIFVPEFAAPTVFRACILEEIAQALGPGNDMFRLEDSAFNDDGAHEWPTAFDLLMLRVLYSPELRPGMKRWEAARAARTALIRIGGGGMAERRKFWADRPYAEGIYGYLSAHDDAAARKSVDKATRYAKFFEADDHRRGEALRRSAFLLHGRGDGDGAIRDMNRAVDLFRRTLPANAARLARARSDLGFFLAEEKRYGEAIDTLREAEAGLAANRIDDELAYTIYLRAVASYLGGRMVEARKAERAALDWAAYVFGADGDTLKRWRRTFADLATGA